MYYTGSNAFASLRQGLVGAWCPSLPNGGSGNTLPDVSGYGNHGVLTNMSPDDWLSGQYGRALDFDGSNDVVDIASRGTGVIPSQADFSVSIWLRSNVTPSATQAFFGQFIALAGNGRCYVGLNASGQVILFLGNDGTLGSVSVLSTTTVTANQWVHVAATRNFRTFSLAINGVVEATTTEASTRTILQTGNTIGLVDFGGTSYIGGPYFQQANGQVDDLRVYRKTLTEPEIRLLASRPGIGLRQDRDRNTFYQFPSGSRRRRILTGMP